MHTPFSRALTGPSHRLHALALAATLVGASGCSTISEFASGDKIDYRTASANSTPLAVPPDLTQLSGDARFLPPTRGSVTASGLAATAAAAQAASAPQTVAPAVVGPVRLERHGDQRWLSVSQSPEALWPQLQAFWQARGLKLAKDQPEFGVMETDWAENRARLSSDVIRRTLAKALDSLYSTGELDKYRMRVERTANGSEIFITHRGMEEIYSGSMKETTVWTPRAREINLEMELLTRLMIQLGTRPEEARAMAAAPAPVETPRARIIEGRPAATLQVDDGFDRAWRRVGVALDRSGFTVEDRDRLQGVYFVRYVDPAQAGKAEPGFFAKLFGQDNKNDKAVIRYRVSVRAEGETAWVSVADANGNPEAGAAGQRIVKLLLDELK